MKLVELERLLRKMRLENELQKFIAKSKDSTELVALLNGMTDYVPVPPLNEAVEVILRLVNEGSNGADLKHGMEQIRRISMRLL